MEEIATNDPGWRRHLRRGLERGDRSILARLPKTDLHCHGMLSAPLATYESLLGYNLPAPPSRFGNFQAFADYIGGNLLGAMTGPEPVRAIVRAALERMVADGVVYAEMSFDLLLPEFIGMQIEAFGELLAAETSRLGDRLTVAPEIGIARGLPAEEAERRLRRWLPTGVGRSIDLYDDENLGDLRDFAPLYRIAKDHGLKLKAHAGELLGADAVRSAVEVLDLDAVQHGVRAVEDPHVVDFLAKRGTLLHICPTSNVSLGIVANNRDHPARRLHSHGVRMTVNTDDYALFAVDVSDELLNLHAMGLDAEAITAMVETGLAQLPENRGRR